MRRRIRQANQIQRPPCLAPVSLLREHFELRLRLSPGGGSAPAFCREWKETLGGWYTNYDIDLGFVVYDMLGMFEGPGRNEVPEQPHDYGALGICLVRPDNNLHEIIAMQPMASIVRGYYKGPAAWDPDEWIVDNIEVLVPLGGRLTSNLVQGVSPLTIFAQNRLGALGISGGDTTEPGDIVYAIRTANPPYPAFQWEVLNYERASTGS